MADDQPEYTLYRARPRVFQRGDDGLEGLRDPGREPGRDGPPRRRLRLTPRRIAGYLLLAIGVWLLASLVAFLVSAQIESSKVSDSAKAALHGAGYPLTSANTVLVLGSDARPKGTHEAGAETIGQPSRSDTILLMRIGGGHDATLSVPRDTVVDIPGHGESKINAAYAFGGAALAIKTVEGFLGVQVNHVVEVNFENFPQLIDALGGITYRGGCVHALINGGRRNGGTTLWLKKGTHELDGKQALALARVRHNLCNPADSDLTRVRRQQKILAAMKDKVTSFETFLRLPLVSWAAPRAIRSDMAGPSLLGLVAAELLSGKAKGQVLRPSGGVTLPDGGAGLTVDPAVKRRQVERFLAG